MKRSIFSAEQIAYALRQAGSGTPVGDVCRQLGVSEPTFYAWKKKYGHLGATATARGAAHVRQAPAALHAGGPQAGARRVGEVASTLIGGTLPLLLLDAARAV